MSRIMLALRVLDGISMVGVLYYWGGNYGGYGIIIVVMV